MEPANNPFRPGAGARPPQLVGRDAELTAFKAIIDRVQGGKQSNPMFFVGLRGVGKTVLLGTLRAEADTAGWFTIGLEISPEDGGGRAAQRLARGLDRVADALKTTPKHGRFAAALKAIDSLSVNVGLTGGGIELHRTAQAATPDIEFDLIDVIDALGPELAKEQRGLGLFVDEMQQLDPAVAGALIAAQHRATQRDWPIYLIGAGLPDLPATLSTARSYAERFDYWTIDALTPEDAALALAEPAKQAGGGFEPEALNRLVAEADGYPYFLQTFAYYAWDLTKGPTITLADAKSAIARGYDRLDDGFFRARWDRAAPLEQEYLTAMAQEPGGLARTTQVAERVGRTTGQLTSTRAALVAKGLIYSPGRGSVRFSIPGFARFIARQAG
jgi:hypothetical protein